jgi:hypothetical protein
MFEAFNNKKKTEKSCSAEEQLIKTEKAIDIQRRMTIAQNQLMELSANQSIDFKAVMDMIGTLGTDNGIEQNIVERLTDVLGNDPDPVKLTKYFSGMIAKRVLTVADVRKIPGNLFASKGGTPLDITSDQVYVQPMHLFGAAALIQPARYKQSPYSVAFDENSQITIGADTFDNYLTNTTGSYSTPFAAHLFVLKRNDTLRGDAKFFVESEFGYQAGLQLTDNTAAVLMLNHQKAIKVESAITEDVGAPPNLVTNLAYTASDLDEQYELTTTSPMEVEVRGTNVSITHYQLPMYTPIAEAVLASLISGRLDMLPTWVLNNLSKTFKF